MSYFIIDNYDNMSYNIGIKQNRK